MHQNELRERLLTAELWQLAVRGSQQLLFGGLLSDLHLLLQKNEFYGAQGRLKDLCESLLKTPLLLAAAVLSESGSPAALACLSEMTGVMTLGNWYHSGRKIVSDCQAELPQPLLQILRVALAVFSRYHLRDWRNDKIAHGALKMKLDEEFAADMLNALKATAETIKESSGYYKKLVVLQLNGQNNAERVLTLETDTRPGDGELFARFGADCQENSLAPFIIPAENGLLYYDGYYQRVQKPRYLDYVSGELVEGNLDCGRQLAALVESSGIQLEYGTFAAVDAAGETIPEEFDTALQQLATVENYHAPRHYHDWLDEQLNTNDKGVFLLQADAGCGKSSFVRAIDQLSAARPPHDSLEETMLDFTVRAVYLDAVYMARPEIFATRIKDALRSRDDGTLIIGRDIYLPEHDTNGSCAKAFAELLNYWRVAQERHSMRRKLLIVVDGLDELPAVSGTGVPDYLNVTGLLDDGVYVLLTCRNTPDCNSYIGNYLSGWQCAATLSISAGSPENRDAITAWLEASGLLERQDAQLREALLQQCQNTFLLAALLKDMALRCGFTAQQLLEGKNLFEEYFAVLRGLYGSRLFEALVETLAVIATAREGLTQAELAFLAGRRQDFLLMAFLRDLQAFIRCERSYRGNVIFIRHTALTQMVNESFRQLMEKRFMAWMSIICCDDITTLDPQNDALVYLFTHIGSYAQEYYPQIPLETVATSLLMGANWLANGRRRKDWIYTRRAADMLRMAYELYPLQDGTEKYAAAALDNAGLLMELLFECRALQLCEMFGAELMELFAQQRFPAELLSMRLRIIQQYARALQFLNKYSQAEQCYSEIEKLLQNSDGMFSKEKLVHKNDLSVLALRRNETEKALELLETAYDEAASDAKFVEVYSMVSCNYVIALVRTGVYEKAENIARLFCAGELVEYCNSAHTNRMMLNLGMALLKQGKLAEARDQYEKLFDKLCKEEQIGEAIDHEITFLTMIHLGSVCNMEQRHVQAATLLERVVDRMQECIEDGISVDENMVLCAYSEIAQAHLFMDDVDAGRRYIEKIRALLNNTGQMLDKYVADIIVEALQFSTLLFLHDEQYAAVKDELNRIEAVISQAAENGNAAGELRAQLECLRADCHCHMGDYAAAREALTKISQVINNTSGNPAMARLREYWQDVSDRVTAEQPEHG